MRRTLLGLCFLVAASCVTPSIPLPPPDIAALSFVAGPDKTTIELQGKPSPSHVNARFSAFNQQRHVGILVDTMADGSFSSEPFAGSAGDVVELWYEQGGKRSQLSACTVTLDVALNNTICH